jgi:hypothetical protein
MVNGKGLTNEEISTFLDWLDKVRVGLWLGILSLEKNPFNINPHFHITKRMAGKDRMVVIYRSNKDWQGISFVGVNFPVFHHAPSCFSLIVNNLGFFNVSTEYLFSRRLGFPFPGHVSFNESRLAESAMKPGRERAMFPLLKYPYSTLGTEIFQPMFPLKTLVNPDRAEFANLYNTTYVHDHSLWHEKGIGLPLIQKDKMLIKYQSFESKSWCPSNSITQKSVI